jgi:hypothetical protein
MKISNYVTPKPHTFWHHPQTHKVYEVLLIAKFLSETLVVHRVLCGSVFTDQSVNLARSLSDWNTLGLTQVTRSEARKLGANIGYSAKNSWAVVSFVPLDQVRNSDELRVVKAQGYRPHPLRNDDLPAEDTWNFDGKKIPVGHVVAQVGRHMKVWEHVVGGTTFDFRDDARTAKRDFVAKHKIHFTTANEFYDVEHFVM